MDSLEDVRNKQLQPQWKHVRVDWNLLPAHVKPGRVGFEFTNLENPLYRKGPASVYCAVQ